MKKTLLFAIPFFIFLGCEKDEASNQKPAEEINKPPVIKSINIEKRTFGINQVLSATATAGDPENDDFELKWTYENKEYNEDKGVFEVRLESLGEKTLLVTAIDEKGNKSTLSEKINVIESDVGFGVWGDKINIIERSETGTFNGWTGKAIGEAGRYKEFRGDGQWRGYTFLDEKLVGGYVTEKFTSKFVNNRQYELIIDIYESHLNELIEKYGDYSSQESSVNWSYGRANAGISILYNGAMIITTFSNDKSNIRYFVQTNEPNVVSYTFEYKKKSS